MHGWFAGMKTIIALFLLWVPVLFAQTAPSRDLTLTTGQIFKNVKVTRVNAAELKIVHDEGVASVPLNFLPPEWSKVYGPFDAHAAQIANERDVQNQIKANAVMRQEKEAVQLLEYTGQPIELLRQAVQMRDWCQTHADGWITSSGRTVTKAERDEQLQIAISILTSPKANATLLPPHQVPTVDQAQAAQKPRVANKAGFVDTIDGEFTGFQVGRKFKMLSGMVWQQIGGDYLYHYAWAPQVQFYDAPDGGLMMKVDGVEGAVPVIQILK